MNKHAFTLLTFLLLVSLAAMCQSKPEAANLDAK